MSFFLYLYIYFLAFLNVWFEKDEYVLHILRLCCSFCCSLYLSKKISHGAYENGKSSF